MGFYIVLFFFYVKVRPGFPRFGWRVKPQREDLGEESYYKTFVKRERRKRRSQGEEKRNDRMETRERKLRMEQRNKENSMATGHMKSKAREGQEEKQKAREGQKGKENAENIAHRNSVTKRQREVAWQRATGSES